MVHVNRNAEKKMRGKRDHSGSGRTREPRIDELDLQCGIQDEQKRKGGGREKN